MSFNGGKMIHLFDFADQNNYSDRYVVENADQILNNGRWFIKIDGSNGHLILNSDGSYDIYQRYDDRKNTIDPENLPDGIVNLPSGSNSNCYTSKEQKHNYYYKKMNRPSDDEKNKDAKMRRKLYAIVDLAQKEGRIAANRISVELCGKNFNRTPGVPDVGIAVHSEQTFDCKSDNYYTYFCELFSETCMEGVIVEHNGTYYKIRAEFFPNNLWKKSRNSAQAPVLL